MIKLSRTEILAGRENANSEKKMEELFDKYVPNSGPADTVLGEIVRAWMRLSYRLWNDGDVPFKGYGKETCESSMKYLIKVVPDVKFPKYSCNEAGYKTLTDYATCLLKYFEFHPELANEKNNEDSRK